jgi:transcription elongation GreA/GreB family factor
VSVFLDKVGTKRQIQMVDNRRPELTKRQKELARARKAQEKADKRAQRHRQRDQPGDSGEPAEDPDIAGIVPGPQPPLEE